MENKINSTQFVNQKIKIINNVNANETNDPDEIKKLLDRSNFLHSEMERQYY